MKHTDFTQRFLFTASDIRGEMVCLEDSYAHVLAKHQYPEPVAALLGELMAAAALLVSTIKFDGLLIMQASSSGAVPLLMVECSSDRQIRALARYEAEQINPGASLTELMPEGLLAITVEPADGQRYQGLVGLNGENLAACLHEYFASSEQLSSHFVLHADGRRARGLLLQQLPPELIKDAQQRQDSWQHHVTMAQTLKAEELLGLENQVILHRLYHDQELELFAETPVEFSCSCSQARSENALVSLGEADVMQLLQEQNGQIVVDCQFCNQRYQFDTKDVTKLFANESENSAQSTVH